MNMKDLIRLGVPPGEPTRRGMEFISRYILKGLDKAKLAGELEAVVRDPASFVDDELRGEFAKSLVRCQRTIREARAAWRQWGEGLEPEAINQMGRACQLPVAVAGALMPDAHVGYGLPIGGVLATDNAVIPYAVGVDIACRMKLSVLDIPAEDLDRLHDQLANTLQRETVFGTGGAQKKIPDHPVLQEDWSVTAITKHVYEKAATQLGTSGSGNHFVEFGILTVKDEGERMKDGSDAFAPSSILHPPSSSFDLPPGKYLSVLSHSGSRGAGATVADRYSKLAMDLRPELPPELRRLAWLDLDSDPGREYWAAMNLMGQYAHANHEVIHQKIARALNSKVIAGVENHHNFAWKEIHNGREVIVHRKGATPAGAGVLGVIPG